MPSNDTPCISVIVPVYNTEAYIGKCLDSLVSQTMREIEFILVDDCGTDRSMDIVRRYAAEDARIRILEGTENTGVAQARNRGMETARGEYTAFVDSDDWLAPDYFRLLYDKAVTEQADMVKGSFTAVWPDRTEPSRMNDGIRQCLLRHSFPGIAYTYAFWNTLFRTDMLRRHHITFPSLTHGEDMVFLVNALLHANKLVLEDGAVYYYNQHDGSTSRAISSRYYDSLFRHYEMIADLLKQSVQPRRDIIDYWQFAIMQPLLTHHLHLADGENTDFYTRFFSQVKRLLFRGGYPYELYYHYPDPFYRHIFDLEPSQFASFYVQHDCRPDFSNKKEWTVRIWGIPVARFKRLGNLTKIRIFGISCAKIHHPDMDATSNPPS